MEPDQTALERHAKPSAGPTVPSCGQARPGLNLAARTELVLLVLTILSRLTFALYLTWQGIDFDQTFQLLVRYNAISNVNLGIHLGLLQSIPSSACARLLSGDWRIVPYTAGQREALGGFVRRRG